MTIFYRNAEIITWAGKMITGVNTLSKAWKPWFANHENFHFQLSHLVVDEIRQTVLRIPSKL